MGALKHGGPAFPHSDMQAVHAIAAAAIDGITDTAERDRIYIEVRGQAAQGMTLRDYFAVQAAQGLLARSFTKDERGRPFVEWVAEFSYELADELLRAREGGAA